MGIGDHLYLLSFATYDEYSPNILLGPKMLKRDFHALCDNLLEQAAFNAVEGEDSWIGWNRIVEQLILLLKDKGFQKLNPPEVKYCGSIIIEEEDDLEDRDLGKAKEAVFKHNKCLKNKQEQWMKGLQERKQHGV